MEQWRWGERRCFKQRRRQCAEPEQARQKRPRAPKEDEEVPRDEDHRRRPLRLSLPCTGGTKGPVVSTRGSTACSGTAFVGMHSTATPSSRHDRRNGRARKNVYNCACVCVSSCATRAWIRIVFTFVCLYRFPLLFAIFLRLSVEDMVLLDPESRRKCPGGFSDYIQQMSRSAPVRTSTHTHLDIAHIPRSR